MLNIFIQIEIPLKWLKVKEWQNRWINSSFCVPNDGNDVVMGIMIPFVFQHFLTNEPVILKGAE